MRQSGHPDPGIEAHRHEVEQPEAERPRHDRPERQRPIRRSGTSWELLGPLVGQGTAPVIPVEQLGDGPDGEPGEEAPHDRKPASTHSIVCRALISVPYCCVQVPVRPNLPDARLRDRRTVRDIRIGPDHDREIGVP